MSKDTPSVCPKCKTHSEAVRYRADAKACPALGFCPWQDDNEYARRMVGDDPYKQRIFNIVARNQGRNRCPHCGYEKFNGGIHPFGGRHIKVRSQQRWCDGQRGFYGKRLVSKS